MVSASWRSTLLTGALVLALLGGVTAALVAHAPPSRQATTPMTMPPAMGSGSGEPAYPFTEMAIGGRRVSLRRDIGRPLVITFFASWCAPCADDAPVLQSVAAHYGRRVAFLAVAAGDTAAPAAAFARRYKWNWPVVVDGDYRLTRQFHVVGTPMTVIVDSRGRVATVLPGAITPSELTATLSRLVA
jgi:cytochrome c biogenesis protein CcmG, thiol:disulfide interchange protein DsbE